MSVQVPGSRFIVKTKSVDGAEVQIFAMQPATSASSPVPIHASTSATVLLAPSPTRLNATVVNDSEATLYLTVGAAPRDPSPSDWDYVLYPGDCYHHDIAPGLAVKGGWSSASGQARITEYT